jgi:DNA repair protein RecO (recombination protein O)
LKGILRPFLPLQLSWVIRSDLGTLTGAEMDGAPISLAGDALLSGYYVNELILNLLHRHDPQPEIYAVYRKTIHDLKDPSRVAATLRRFEMETLGLLGYALNLDHDTRTGRDLSPDSQYEYRPGEGPVPVGDRNGPLVFSGAELRAIARQEFDEQATLIKAGILLRYIIAWHLDGKELKSRKVLQEMRRTAGGQSQKSAENE